MKNNVLVIACRYRTLLIVDYTQYSIVKTKNDNTGERTRMRRSSDVIISDISEFAATGEKGAESKHQVVKVTEKKTGHAYYDKPADSLALAQAEVITQELNRAYNPANPQTRLVKDGSRYHVLSRDVELTSLYELMEAEGVDQVIDKINAGIYKNFGGSVVVSVKANDADSHTGNIGINAKNEFVRIDGDWCNARLRYGESVFKFNITSQVIQSLPMLSTSDFFPYHWFDQVNEGETALAKDISFINKISSETVTLDMNKQILTCMLLPAEYMKKIMLANVVDQDEGFLQLEEHIKSKLQLIKSACTTKSFQDFMNKDAEKTLEEYIGSLQKYVMNNGLQLDEANAIADKVRAEFSDISKLVNSSSNQNEWQTHYDTLLTRNCQTRNGRANQLFLALEAHDAETLRAALHQKKDGLLETKNEYQRTPLLQAVRYGFTMGFHYLRNEGADLFVKDSNGDMALALAAKYGHLDIITESASNEAVQQDAVNHAGESAIILAAQQNYLNVVEYLLKQKVNPVLTDDKGKSALVHAAGVGHTNVVNALLNNTVVIQEHAQVHLAFHYAVHNSHFETANAISKVMGTNFLAKDNISIQYLRIQAAAQGPTANQLFTAILDRNSKDIDLALADGTTAAYHAAKHDNAVILARLTAAKANIHHQNNEGISPFDVTIQNGNLECIKVMIDSGQVTQKDLDRAFYAAVQSKQNDVADFLLNNGAAGNHTPPAGADSALKIAVSNGNIELAVRILRDPGFDHSLQINELDALLTFACAEKHDELAEALLERKADVNFVDDSHSSGTPLILAARSGAETIVDLILKHPNFNSLNERNAHGSTAFSVAAESNEPDIARKIGVLPSADLLLQDNHQHNGFYYLLQDKHDDLCVELAIAHHLQNQPIREKNEDTLLHIFARNDNCAAAEKLMAAKADVNALNKNHETPFMIAAMQGNTAFMKLLLEHGAKPSLHVPDNNGVTPLMAAVENEETAAAVMILKSGKIDFAKLTNRAAEAFRIALFDKHDFALCDNFITAGFDVNTVIDGEFKNRCLHIAASNNDQAALDYLCGKPNLDLSAQNSHGRTAATLATANKNFALADTLVKMDRERLAGVPGSPLPKPRTENPAEQESPKQMQLPFF